MENITIQGGGLVGRATALDNLAKQKGVTAVIDAGVVPGLSNLILGRHVQQMEVEDYECLFGGLPENPKGPVFHQDFYPPQELFEEYLIAAEVIEQGKVKFVNPLNNIEQIEFPGIGVLDAIHYNGLKSLSTLVCKKVRNMQQKMLRAPGHLTFINALSSSGLLNSGPIRLKNGLNVNPIGVTTQSLAPGMRFGENDSDTILLRITLRNRTHSYAYELIVRYHFTNRVSAMARTTGYTCAAISRLVLNDKLTQEGIIFPEFIGMHIQCFATIIDGLCNCGLRFKITQTETSNIQQTKRSVNRACC